MNTENDTFNALKKWTKFKLQNELYRIRDVHDNEHVVYNLDQHQRDVDNIYRRAGWTWEELMDARRHESR